MLKFNYNKPMQHVVDVTRTQVSPIEFLEAAKPALENGNTTNGYLIEAMGELAKEPETQTVKNAVDNLFVMIEEKNDASTHIAKAFHSASKRFYTSEPETPDAIEKEKYIAERIVAYASSNQNEQSDDKTTGEMARNILDIQHRSDISKILAPHDRADARAASMKNFEGVTRSVLERGSKVYVPEVLEIFQRAAEAFDVRNADIAAKRKIAHDKWEKLYGNTPMLICI